MMTSTHDVEQQGDCGGEAAGRREAAEMFLRSATQGLQAKKHISTRYPPQFMPTPALHQRLLKWLGPIVTIGLVGFFVYGSISPAIIDDDTARWLCIGFCPVLMLLISLCLCSFYPLEYIDKLNFLAVQIINLGSIVNVIFGHGNFVPGTKDDLHQAVGALAGLALLTIGTIMFSACTFVLGPWEFMVGSPLLAVGLIFRSCAAYMSFLNAYAARRNGANVEEPSQVIILNIIACPFLFIGLAFVFKKAYQLMRLPILGKDNYRFFGLLFYGGSILANGIINIIIGTSQSMVDDGLYAFIVSITNSLAFFGTSTFLLDASRAKHHYNAVMEDRYPSTLYLIRHKEGFAAATIATSAALISSFVTALVALQETFDSNNNSISLAMNSTSSLLVGVTFFVFCGFVFYPSLRVAWDLKETKISRMLSLTITGCGMLAMGNMCRGVASLWTFNVEFWCNLCSGFGALVLLISSALMEAPCEVSLMNPRTWENVYHPCNYVLLASVWFIIGSSLNIFAFDALGSLCNTWAFLILLLHFNMSFYVWESMTLQVDEKEVNTTTKMEAFDDTGKMVDGLEGDETSEVENHNRESADVIICGGGISGLFLASILGKAGVKVLICEKRLQSTTDARFAVLNSASMEHMAEVLDSDILKELESRALPESTHYGSMLLNGLGHPKARVIAAANSPSRRVLMENLSAMDDWTESRTIGSRYSSHLPLRVMQSHQEDVLKMQLQRYNNVSLLQGWMLGELWISEETGVKASLLEVNEDENGVQHQGGSHVKKMVYAKYIVGCDGPSSVVAKKLQIKFDGLLNLADTRSLLVHIPGLYTKVVQSLGNTHQYQIIRKNFGLAGVVAADPYRDLWNVLFMFGDKAKEATSEEICRQFFGVDNFEVVQNRSWYWNFFIAREFRKNKRAFLVGDSAHSWPPFGALGGNSAYGDAINLGWKLALACKGKASELLLESYAVERRQHILQTAMYVMRATPQPELMQLLTSRVFYNPLYMPFIRAGWYHHNSGTHGSNHFSQSGTQLGIKLNFSPIIMREEVVPADDPSCEYKPSFRAGARLPFLPFQNSQENIFSFINSAGYTLLVVKPECSAFAQDLFSSVRNRGMSVTLSYLPTIYPECYEGNYRKIADLLLEESFLVIRPDHVIAWRVSDVSALDSFIADQAASKITGVDQDGNCLSEAFRSSSDAKTIVCYQSWLTREFKFSLRPYKFRFPKSIPVDNLVKEDAIAIAKAKVKPGQRFLTTTKQGAQNTEGQIGVVAGTTSVKVNSKLSAFELNIDSIANPVAKLIQLASEREAEGLHTYNLGAGNPSVDPPREILESFKNLSTQSVSSDTNTGLFRYTNTAGVPELRTYIAEYLNALQGTENIEKDHVVMTPGAQSALVSVYEALLGDGDHVLVQSPFYPAYKPIVELWGGKMEAIGFVGDELAIDLEHLEQLAERAGEKLRVIQLCSPSNPTGDIVDTETLGKIASLARKHSRQHKRDVWLVVDHTYHRLSFDGNVVPPTFPLYEDSLLISSFSKCVGLAGERIGYIAVNPSSAKSQNIAKWLVNNNDRLGNISPPSFIQHVLVDVIKSHGKIPSNAGLYGERVRFLQQQLLLTAGVKSCSKPKGSFYLFPSLPDGVDDIKLAEQLVSRGVLVIPGSAFGAPGYVRVAALSSCEEMAEACDVIRIVINEMSGVNTGIEDLGSQIFEA